MYVLEYYVCRNEDGVTMWLADDETSWTPHLHYATAFNEPALADDIAKRELGEDRVYFVMGCMSSQ